MKKLVNEIIVPYFERKKHELGIERPEELCSILKIDCWSVHKSKEYLNWMKETHTTVIVIFVLGNCTSLFQPLNVGVQQVLKQLFKQSSHTDIVKEVSKRLGAGTSMVTLDLPLPTQHERLLGWLVKKVRDTHLYYCTITTKSLFTLAVTRYFW
ncbi:hypothetical protein K435DRAFT_667767 [Dendrothele bispora CBS 962.96]|uniref:DDE-1 domain-containing protein n=1 Tax=Dendrothele bispora (strain CBS 962.96) TaxID=1314807 RepID=A0A4S8LZL2_DENBC|nr:hypothetical protein K435DRAFT_667767 [Dendrothele bispora CBS 962.96]